MNKKNNIDYFTLYLSSLILITFVFFSYTHSELLTNIINKSFSLTAKHFGLYWQILMFANFIIAICLAALKTGRIKLGSTDQVEMSDFKWLAIILCTLLAGGGVFWAAAEPIEHYLHLPPYFLEPGTSAERSVFALSQTFIHWGFLAWAILGTLCTIVLMHLHHQKGLPLKPRTLLYPVFGNWIMRGIQGGIIDTICVISVAAGTIGPIGFLGIQVSYALSIIFNLPNSYLTQIIVILIAVIIYTLSTLSGLNKGIQLLSRYNVMLAFFLLCFILLFGPFKYIVFMFFKSVTYMTKSLVPIALYQGDPKWLGQWTLFFWGWFLGYTPVMAIFIAQISKGRTVRELIIAIAIISPLVSCLWFTVLGGSGLAYEMLEPGSISKNYLDFGVPSAIFSITNHLPFSTLISTLFIILSTIFIITTSDSITYSISRVISNDAESNKGLRVFWAFSMGVIAIILIHFGEGGISQLQSVIMITAGPVSLFIAPSIFYAPYLLYKSQFQNATTEAKIND